MHCFHHIHSRFHQWLQNTQSKSNSHSSIFEFILPTVGSVCLALLALHRQYVQKADSGYAYKRPDMPILVHLKSETKAQIFKVLQPLCLWKRLSLTQKYYRDAYCTPLRQKEAQIWEYHPSLNHLEIHHTKLCPSHSFLVKICCCLEQPAAGQ